MSIRGNLRQLINRWESWIFAADDAVAHARGWQISRPPNGFSRVYRDPRWDLISKCEVCGGNAGEPCQSCEGRGKVRHSPTDAPLGGAP